MNKKSKSAIAKSEVTRVVQMFFGIPSFIFNVFLFVSALGDLGSPNYEPGLMISLAIVFGTLTGCSVLLIVSSIRRKHMVKEFRKYVGIISASHNGSFELIAKETNTPVNKVQSNIEWMVSKQFFYNARINLVDDCIDIPGLTEVKDHIIKEATFKVVTCKYCGARTSIEEGKITPCPYCSSPLQS